MIPLEIRLMRYGPIKETLIYTMTGLLLPIPLILKSKLCTQLLYTKVSSLSNKYYNWESN